MFLSAICVLRIIVFKTIYMLQDVCKYVKCMYERHESENIMYISICFCLINMEYWAFNYYYLF